jgi:hypothetical protein
VTSKSKQRAPETYPERSTHGQPDADPIWQPFSEFWNRWVEKSDEVTRQWTQQVLRQDKLEEWRRQWLEAVSESCEAYMRSPAFLEAMKHQADATVKMKAQANDLAREAARNLDIPTAGDISGLFERVHSVEEALLSRLARIEEKLARIDEKLSQ